EVVPFEPRGSKCNCGSIARKSVRFGDSNFEEVLIKWYKDVESEVSDIDDVSECDIESEHDTESEFDTSEDLNVMK
ncbi:hypothetical protein Trydic_g13832, partial [Trypoxylus dichotomus]